MEQEEQQIHQLPPRKPSYSEIAIMWWFHPINAIIYFIIFTTGVLTTGAFSYAVGLERDALRNILGEDMAISHKEVLYRGFGYRIVRERDTPGQIYSPGEVLVNLESRESVKRVREGERFERAARVGAVKAEAKRYSARDRHTERYVNHLSDEDTETLSEIGLID